MITYKERLNSNNEIEISKVFLDGKFIGEIHLIVETRGWDIAHYWQYRPKGCSRKFAGEKFKSLHACKHSLEQE